MGLFGSRRRLILLGLAAAALVLLARGATVADSSNASVQRANDPGAFSAPAIESLEQKQMASVANRAGASSGLNLSEACNVTLAVHPQFKDGVGARNRRRLHLFILSFIANCGFLNPHYAWYDHARTAEEVAAWNALFALLPSRNTACTGASQAEDGCFRANHTGWGDFGMLRRAADSACRAASLAGTDRVLLSVSEPAIVFDGTKLLGMAPPMQPFLPWIGEPPCHGQPASECEPARIHVAVHVRRGDILGNPRFKGVALPNSYYVAVCNAIEWALAENGLPAPRIRIFMDSVPDSLALLLNLSDFDAVHAPHTLEVRGQEHALEAFRALVRADILVTSNSGFSTVPAMLHDQGRGIVIMPFNPPAPRPDFFLAFGNETRDAPRLKYHFARYRAALEWRASRKGVPGRT